MLEPEIQAEILSLHFGKQRKIRTIARELGINRESVRAVVRRRAVMLERASPKRKSVLDIFKPQIEELLRREPMITSHTILQRVKETGYNGGYTILREWVTKRREVPSRSREAFLELHFEPGECAQVDWGEFGDVFGDGIKIHCFVMVLCSSRLLFIEFTRSEKFEEFIRCHENAFRFFGGVPQECWFDNLATAVTERMGSLIRFNARFMAYMGHHGIHPQACNPARGNEKGRVEDGVKYIRGSFWAGRVFQDFKDLCQQATHWRDETANKREHRTTRKIPILHFESEEKACLRPMNPHSYDTDEVFTRVVSPNFHIPYDTNKYSTPWTLVGMSVTVRVNDREIRIFYQERFITTHERCYQRHQTITKPEHVQGLLERKPGVSKDSWQVSALKSMGPIMSDYLKLIRSGSRSLRSEVAKLMALVTIYGETEALSAVTELLKTGVVGSENLELFLKSRGITETAPAPISFQNPKLNRFVPSVDLRRYDALLFKSTENNTHQGGEDANEPF